MSDTFTPWSPSPEAIAGGRAAHVVYRNAPLRSEIPPEHRGVARTQLPITPGLRVLRAHVVGRFPFIRQTYMPGRSRPMLDTQRLDMHQAGRAIDFMVPQLGHAPDHAHGDQIANYLAANAERFGVQFIVWSGYKFNAGARTPAERFAPYTGTVPHLDHPHVEITPEAGALALPWYQTQQAPAATPSDATPAPFEDAGGPSPLAMAGVALVSLAAVAAGVWLIRRR